MGLISKEVEVRWNFKTKQWYINKNYPFTKMGDKFIVKIEDLTKGSGILVKVKCDNPNCENPYLKPMTYDTYNRIVHDDGKYYCLKCAINLYATENMKTTKLLKTKSFEQWCIDNNRQDVLDRWDYNLNNCRPNEICYSTGCKRYFKCPRGIHESELKKISNFTSGKEGSMKCNACNSFAQWGIDNIGEDFLEKYWDYEKNTIYPFKIDSSASKKVYIICQVKEYHESYPISPYNFIKNKRCPYCVNRKIHPLDSLGRVLEDKELLYLWSDKNKKSPYEYPPWSKEKVYWKCPDDKHEDYRREIGTSNSCNFKCSKCSKEREESILQKKIRLYLKSLNNNYIILHEYNCTIIPKNPKTKMLLPFDNEIKELKLIIEVHGKQHYKITSYTKQTAIRRNTTPIYELHYQKVKDRYKRIFAKSREYFYLEIPYWNDDKEENWKKLIDNKISEINRIIDIKYIEEQNKSA